MQSPVLRAGLNEGCQEVLVLCERNQVEMNNQEWFKSFNVDIIRHSQLQFTESQVPLHYKVYLTTANCQAMNLLNAIEEFLDCGNTRMYKYKNEEYIDRQAWLGDLEDGKHIVVVEDGAMIWGRASNYRRMGV